MNQSYASKRKRQLQSFETKYVIITWGIREKDLLEVTVILDTGARTNLVEKSALHAMGIEDKTIVKISPKLGTNTADDVGRGNIHQNYGWRS